MILPTSTSQHVAVYTHTFHGKQRVVGPFPNLLETTFWIADQEDDDLWRALPMEAP